MRKLRANVEIRALALSARAFTSLLGAYVIRACIRGHIVVPMITMLKLKVLIPVIEEDISKTIVI